ncbi:MAG TPA: isoprenylcysteine carboxylmethyltransferase family protein [Sphingomicrobium sp.]|nr:isoprenylcysteine carboxylmethyltransferase family protein [Sphingomicrobium sp.]
MVWYALALVGDILLALIIFVWRPWVQLKRHGVWGVIMFRSTSAGQTFRDILTVLMFVVLIGQALVFVFAPQHRALLFPSESVSNSAIMHVAGAIILIVGLVLLPATQLHLGVAWRVGIDPGAKLGLVTDGYYRLCRNPIFLAILTVLLGNAVLIPTAFSAIIVVATYFWFRMQAAAEEGYLFRVYGDEYSRYAGRVGRFTPFTGRIASKQ